MSICKQVSSDLERVEYISLSLKDAKVEKNELNAIMHSKNEFVISERTVYIVHSKDLRF
jgi:hypothetical protein